MVLMDRIHGTRIIFITSFLSRAHSNSKAKRKKKNKYKHAFLRIFDDANHHRDVQYFQNNCDDHRE